MKPVKQTKQKMPLISIITLNWNQTELTLRLLGSISRLDYPAIEVIVCEMGSTLDPGEQVLSRYPSTRLVHCERNLGSSGGINRGILHASGDYMLVLRNDTLVSHDLVEQLLKAFEEDPLVGVACPKILYRDDPHIIKYAGLFRYNRITGSHVFPGKGEKDKGQYDTPAYSVFAHSAAMMFSRALVEEVGLFHEKYFVYYQEMDWSARVRKAGFRIRFQPAAVVFQQDESHRRPATEMKVYYTTRNRILYMRRQSTRIQYGLFLLYFTLLYTPYSLLRYSLHRQYGHARHFMKGLLWNLG